MMSADIPLTNQVENLVRRLIAVGLVEDARWLNETLTVRYKTSLEMYCELGSMLRRIHRSIPTDAKVTLDPIFDDCEQMVRCVLPEFRVRAIPTGATQ